MNRAYSIIEAKSLDEEKRTFSGVATTPRLDRMGDSVDPMGAKFKNPLVLLHQHDSRSPIGSVRFSKATPDGIEFEATIPKITEPGLLKDRVDLAWGEIKAGLVRAVSIGFRVLEDGIERLNNGGLLFKAIEIIELSAVSVPANADCSIQAIKQFDSEARANADATINEIRSIDSETLAATGNEPTDEIDLTGARLVPNAPAVKAVRVVHLNAPARDRAEPFVIRQIVRTRK